MSVAEERASIGLESFPNTLYKYYSFDERYNEKRLQGELFFNSPNNFNDLFDAQHEIDNNIDLFEQYDDICKRLKEIGYENSQDVISVLKIKDDNSNQLKMDIRRKQIEHVGITCFTNNPLSVLMWAYYNDNKGYCIEYDVNVIRKNIVSQYQNILREKGNAKNRILAKSVTYTNTLPSAPLFFNKDNIIQILDKYFYKSKCWEHENEFRIVLSLGAMEILFFENVIKSITIGYNMKKENIENLLKLILKVNSNIEVYFLRKIRGYDGLERVRYPQDELKNNEGNLEDYMNL
ncbi:MAG: DUF2971 domain-containing protein [Bacteroidales bacterium]|nr:DUF2971 domain-containing protein [Bacteroidales bacterium]